MLGLGQEVLRKIENLLVEVDKKKNKNIQKERQNTTRSKSKQQNQHKNQAQHQKKKSSRRRQEQSVMPSVRQEDKQNAGCSARLQQLYLNYFHKQRRILDRNLLNMQQEMKKLSNFKVQNKTSQYLLNKKKLKPIHERTSQILQKKQKSIQKIKESLPRKKEELEDEEAEIILQEHRRKYPKLSKQEFQRKMQEMEQRNLLRMEKLQQKRLKQLEQKTVLFLEKPDLNSFTKAWWQKKKLKKNLSSNLLERFSQYEAEKKQKWDQYLQKRKLQQTPFTPRISQATKKIATKSMSRRSLLNSISRSHSCRLLNKPQQSTFLERRQVEQTDRNHSRNLLHGKSVATMCSSRNAMLEKRFN